MRRLAARVTLGAARRQSLLNRDPGKRLGHAGGARVVQAHAFFKGLDFDALMARKAAPPPLNTPKP